MKPNQQHKALRQHGLFRPRTEPDRRREAAEAAPEQDYARDARDEGRSERQRHPRSNTQ